MQPANVHHDLSFDELLKYKGKSWARRTAPHIGSAHITDVQQLDAIGKWGWCVIFDEGTCRSIRMNGYTFQQRYQPVSEVAIGVVPAAVVHAMCKYEDAVHAACKSLAGTAQYNHLLSEERRTKEELLRAITDAIYQAEIHVQKFPKARRG